MAQRREKIRVDEFMMRDIGRIAEEMICMYDQDIITKKDISDGLVQEVESQLNNLAEQARLKKHAESYEEKWQRVRAYLLIGMTWDEAIDLVKAMDKEAAQREE